MNHLARLLGVCAVSLFATTACFADDDRDDDHDSDRFSFALWGDMPYAKNGDTPKMAALLASMNADRSLAFTIFDGDTKDGSSKCTDEAIGSLPMAFFNQLNAPTVYVPGDNEWTDCHRTNNGGYNNLERLAFLRANLFAEAESFGQERMMLEHQGEPGTPYSENTRWMKQGVLFVGLNIPGSNNNKVNPGTCLSAKSVRTESDCADDNAEYAERNAKNLAWLSESFAKAQRHHAAGVMVVIQADPSFDLPETEGIDERTATPDVDGYNDFLASLAAETQAFAGQVVLAHGDTHFFKIDKPLFKQANLLKNFTRVETFGSPNVHWIKVTADRNSEAVFNFQPVIVPGN